MHPDAQEILDTLEDNRDWYQSTIPQSPSPPPLCQDKELNACRDKFQFELTLEDRSQTEQVDEEDANTTNHVAQDCSHKGTEDQREDKEDIMAEENEDIIEEEDEVPMEEEELEEEQKTQMDKGPEKEILFDTSPVEEEEDSSSQAEDT